MNIIKYRPVGKSTPIVRIRVSQKKHSPLAKPAQADRAMDRRGYVRAGKKS